MVGTVWFLPPRAIVGTVQCGAFECSAGPLSVDVVGTVLQCFLWLIDVGGGSTCDWMVPGLAGLSGVLKNGAC